MSSSCQVGEPVPEQAAVISERRAVPVISERRMVPVIASHRVARPQSFLMRIFLLLTQCDKGKYDVM